MTREEAKSYLIDISYKLGNMAVEYLTEKDGTKMREAIQALQQEPRWIPVSERLPEEHKEVIASDVFGVYIGEFIDAEETWGGKHFVNEHGMHSKSVTAWMPLPEPYQGDTDGNED